MATASDQSPQGLADSKDVVTLGSEQPAQCLRAAVLAANDGLVLVTSLILVSDAVNQTAKAMLIPGVAALIAGAFNKAVGEYVSVYSQVDYELAQMEMEKRYADIESSPAKEKEEKDKLRSPLQKALTSAVAFGIGAVFPLLAGAFIGQYSVRISVVSGISTLALALFGWAGAFLGGSPVWKSTVRVVVGGWASMLVTFGVAKLFRLVFKMDVRG